MTLFSLGIMLVVLGILAFGFSAEVQNGFVVSFKLLTITVDSVNTATFLPEFAKTTSGFFRMIFTFLFLLALGGFTPELLTNPLTPLTLTKGIRRSTLFVSSLPGVFSALVGLLVIFGFLLSLILTFKMWPLIISSPMIAMPSFAYEILVLLAYGSLLGMLIQHPTATSVVLIAVNIIGGLLGSTSKLTSPFLIAVRLILPPAGHLNAFTSGILFPPLESAIPWLFILLSLAQGLTCIAVTLFLFQRREF